MRIPKLPSRITVEGLDRAPHRAFLRALGLSDADLGKPFVGVASTDGRVTPCNALLGEFARQACAAIRGAGGVPFDFASISVADSMSMNHGGMRYSLVSREIIADGVEAVARGHAYDALVTFAGCDKTLPGMMMAMVRLNLPSVFVYGGAALPGKWQGRDVTVLDTYEAVGAVLAGDMQEDDLRALEHACRRWARARDSSPPTRWRWWRRRSAAGLPARRPCQPFLRNETILPARPARS